MPKVSIVIPTYNRAPLLGRALTSLLQQTFNDWEAIVVDDGSTDSTSEVIAAYPDSRIHLLIHEHNRGVTAALNTGMNAIRGDWFTFLGSDDEIVPNALETLLEVPEQIDRRISAVTCNCIDSVSGEFSGTGLTRDQFVDLKTFVRKLSGEHWGITRTSLLGDLRLDEEARGGEAVLWFRISKSCIRYYLHTGLRIYHTEGDDRICGESQKKNLVPIARLSARLAQEKDYMAALWKWKHSRYSHIIAYAGLYCVLQGESSKSLALALKSIFSGCYASAVLIAMSTVLGKNNAQIPFLSANRLRTAITGIFRH